MEEWTAGVKVAVAAVVLVVIIGIVIAFVNIGYLAAEDSQDTMTAQTASLSEKIYSPYDGKIVSGADILTAAEQFRGQDTGIVIQYSSSSFVTVSGPKIKPNTAWNTGAVYSYYLSGGKLVYEDYISSLYNVSSDNYINPTAKYQAYLCRNASGTIIGICFYTY